MLLGDQAGSVELSPLQYQFSAASGDPYDDNWLVVGGSVTTPEGTWAFTDPCLLIGEARQVSAWLRAVAAGTVAATGPDTGGSLSPDTSRVEPQVGIAALLHAADQWDPALASFPAR
ncbi:hypothetical protein [Streptomyces canus]|uniref:WapI family immunity protein n=1 Tax=Streptomyces canus TaxID=58343 RepID=UPI0036E015C8